MPPSTKQMMSIMLPLVISAPSVIFSICDIALPMPMKSTHTLLAFKSVSSMLFVSRFLNSSPRRPPATIAAVLMMVPSPGIT